MDEHILIKKEFKNFLLCKNRVSGIFEAEKKKFDTVILDDGFQDYKINKNSMSSTISRLKSVSVLEDHGKKIKLTDKFLEDWERIK